MRGILLLSALLVLLPSGCASTKVAVPKDATLIWYGPAAAIGSQNFTVNATSGQFYVFEDERNRVVQVVPVTFGKRFEIPDLEEDHHYRIYFAPNAFAVGTTQPTTEPLKSN